MKSFLIGSLRDPKIASGFAESPNTLAVPCETSKAAIRVLDKSRTTQGTSIDCIALII
jgi:hypothetical protein